MSLVFLTTEYWDNLNVHFPLRNTLCKWIPRFPNLVDLRHPSFSSNLRMILQLFDWICFSKPPVALDVSRFAFHMLTWHSTFCLQQSSYTTFHTHTAFSFGGRCSSMQPGRFGVRNPTGPKFVAPIQTGPQARPAPSTVGTVGLVPGGKAAGAWRWPPTPFSAVAAERVEL